MRKSIIFSLAVLAVMAFAVMPAVAGPSCGSVDAKLGKADKAACSAHGATTANAIEHDCDYKGKCETVSISVKGMTCAGCENGLTTALVGQEGVVKVLKVSHKENLAVLCFDPTKTKSATLTKMIAAKGYEANVVNAAATTNAVQAGAKDAAGCATMSKADCAKACGSKDAKACGSKKKAEEKKVDGSL